MAIVLPHGVLFRGAKEGAIRKKLLENGFIDTIIGLPSNLFTNTSIPTCIIVLRKDHVNKNVLFIDASNDFEKNKNSNKLRQEDVDKIVATYLAREDVEKYAHVADFEEIKENDFNLNIPRYVDTFEEEEPIDLSVVTDDIVSVDAEIKEAEAALLQMMNELVGTDDEATAKLKNNISKLEGVFGK
jgi:type I restriction enzyme M protein